MKKTGVSPVDIPTLMARFLIKTVRIGFSFVLLFALASCDNKELQSHSAPNPTTSATSRTKFVFDWRHAPHANPASMELCVYPEGADDHLSFNLSGKEGGNVMLLPGVYGAISMNNDDLDWALYRNTNDVEDFEVYTHDAKELGAYKLLAASLPLESRAPGERLAATPELSWSTRIDSFVVTENEEENVITLYPEELVCRYTVEVRDVGNILSARGEMVDGTLSGMAEGYRHGSRITTDTPVTMPFVMNIDYEKSSLRGEFYTFGECHTIEPEHTLTIYLFLSDGSKWYYTFDVHEQVAAAPDPKNVDIVITGLTLPKPLTGGGMMPDVNEWKTEEVYIKM